MTGNDLKRLKVECGLTNREMAEMLLITERHMYVLYTKGDDDITPAKAKLVTLMLAARGDS